MGVPADSERIGYADFDVQELIIRVETTRYRLEKWRTPEGKLFTAKLPAGAVVESCHFGPTLQSFILYQYYHALVTEPLLHEQLREYGVQISTGQLHRLITEGKERFHREKDEILEVGLRVCGHVHTDDTGARHKGKNGYCTHIGNECRPPRSTRGGVLLGAPSDALDGRARPLALLQPPTDPTWAPRPSEPPLAGPSDLV